MGSWVVRMNRRRIFERGFTFVEVLIALLVLNIIAVGFLSALVMSSNSALSSDEHTSAESLARSEMEYVQNSIYIMASWSYTMPPGAPPWDPTHTISPGYTSYLVNVSASPLRLVDDGIQRITIVITRGSRTLYTLENFKVSG
jgi:prepilin-type N-terminal cleavage/methylation domain-containing protein